MPATRLTLKEKMRKSLKETYSDIRAAIAFIMRNERGLSRHAVTKAAIEAVRVLHHFNQSTTINQPNNGGTMSKKRTHRAALEGYAASYIVIKAHEAILAFYKAAALEELNLAGGTAIVNGVEFCIKQISEKKYGADVQAIIENLEEQIAEQKKRAEEAGKVRVSYKETLVAKIPKSSADDVLMGVKEYARMKTSQPLPTP